MPWSRVKRIIESRNVRVGNMIVADPAYRVKAGKSISIGAGVVERPAGAKASGPGKPAGAAPAAKKAPAKDQPARVRTPVAVPDGLNILYSDDAIVVADKPAGLTTSRSAEEAAELGGRAGLPTTLADLLPGLLGTPDRPVTAVHRLDRDTSGVIVFARTQAAAIHLSDQFRRHAADRKYLALVRGKPANGRIESTLVRDRGDGRRGSGDGPGGKRAVTVVRMAEAFNGYAVAECRLETGRTHQVRIHLGETGTPLCGEKVYDRRPDGSKPPDGSGAARPMLHAVRLGFVHPETGEKRTWDAPPAADFAALLAKLKGPPA